ncbi:MAG: recombinase [Bacteroidetes bacterium CG18_big_fil_WC_8_21_14_2_50_41_14]|nr:MAG: recombinase [Bacteroidetes bacterium CG18_big_fil_WC_8_21_14_2_50_41_14]PJB57370.1 MAG: recombinase [Bacteroidetes bacterium CG_4_9_14_3_um_filter_41_19]
MANTPTFGILFHTRKSKKLKDKTVPIYLRITIDGKRTEYSIKRTVDPDRWNPSAGKARGTNDDSSEINSQIQIIHAKVKKAYKELIDDEVTISGPAIISKISGKEANKHTLINTFKLHNQQMSERAGFDYAKATVVRYDTTLKHVQDILTQYYNATDIPLKKLDFEFISNMDAYLRITRGCNHNTTMKYIKNLKRVIHFAIDRDLLEIDPFIKFKTTIKEVKRNFLSEEDLNKLMNKKFVVDRLDLVRDIFVFSCFTGLSYIDITTLSKNNISKGIDGNDWIVTDRKKTGTESRIILLPKAREIIDKYKDHPMVEDKGTLLPIYSNQKMNGYLKEIADLTGIDFNLTFHLARHTFATTVTLQNGVSIETVSAMLGHKNIRTTQIYAKVVDQKISNDMSKLLDKFSPNTKSLKNAK